MMCVRSQGDNPCPGPGGSPSLAGGGGYSMGYPPGQDRMGYPLASTGWGTPWPGQDGVPLASTGSDTPLARSGWGTLWPGLDGVPLPRPGQDGVPPGQDWMGYPLGQVRMGYPLQPGLDGVSPPSPRTGRGTPPGQDWGTHSWEWGTPGSEQQSEYLLHGGRYASCDHARGLSCIILVS